MTWKHKFGQILGIIVGVTVGSAVIHIGINALKSKTN
jgi:hypothetical protein